MSSRKQTVAIYARYSTDKQDKSSIDGQVRNCRAKAKELGLKIAKVFKDEARSGTDLNRPGYLALIEAMDCSDYDGVIVDDVDRFSRNNWSLAKFTEELTFRNQFMLDCAGYDSRDNASELVGAVKSAIAKMELKKISRRVYRGVRERADRGFSAGGLAYGFRRPEIDPTTGEREVRKWHKPERDPKTAPIVVEIFKMYFSGMSPRAIASELNARNIPSPGAKWNRKSGNGKPTDGKWRASAINAMLDNDIYRGVYIWNKRQFRKDPKTGKRKCNMRPRSEWIQQRIDVQIVDDLLWTRVQKRRVEVRKKSKGIRDALKKRKGHSQCGIGRRPKYLLSGILKCTSCGSNFVMRDTRRYKCANQCNGAEGICDNTLAVRRDHAEEEILGAVAHQILSDENIDRMIRVSLKAAAEQHKATKSIDPSKLQARIATIEKQMGNLADAIAKAGFTTALQKRHGELEAEYEQLTAKLATTTNGGLYTKKLTVDLRKGLRRLRHNIESLSKVATSPHATAQQRARLKTALEDFLGEVPLRPDCKAGTLVATVKPSKTALALLATEPAPRAYRSGSGGRI